MGNELDFESILRDLTNDVWAAGYDQPFSLVIGKNWAKWARVCG